MKTSVDPKLHWTDHYVEYGFAIVKRVIDPGYVAEALDEVKRFVGNNLPIEQWTAANVPKSKWTADGGPHTPVLNRIYDQPRVRAVIDEMFGDPTAFNNDRRFKLFIKPYDPSAKRALHPKGHIDFVNSPVPVFGSGFMFQISLVDKEPFGGNITIWPGTHKIIQRCAMNDMEWQFPKNWADVPDAEPFEFVPEAGDMLLFHHLVEHEGNPCCTRLPRVSLHCQALREDWLTEIDPAESNLSPWARSLAQNGRFRLAYDEKKRMLDYYSSKRSKDQKEKLAAAYK